MTSTVLTPSDLAPNFGTLAQRIKEEIHRARSLDDDFAKKAVCSAIQHYSGQRFHFNEGTHSFLTVASQGEYGQESSLGANDGYSEAMLRPDVVVLERSTNWRYPLDRISYNEYASRRAWITTTGYPCCWTWHRRKMFLWPFPSTADWKVIVDFVKDIGTPIAKYASGAWSYVERTTGDSVTDNWTSDWFKFAEELIRARAEWDIYMNVLNDVQRAETAKMVEKGALDAVVGDSDNFQQGGSVVPWGW